MFSKVMRVPFGKRRLDAVRAIGSGSYGSIQTSGPIPYVANWRKATCMATTLFTSSAQHSFSNSEHCSSMSGAICPGIEGNLIDQRPAEEVMKSVHTPSSWFTRRGSSPKVEFGTDSIFKARNCVSE